MSLNVDVKIGRLTDQPAEGRRNNDQSSAKFSLAVQRNYKNKNGDYDVDFIPCWAYGHSADYLLQYGGKGDTVSIRGELRQNRWTDEQGNKHSYLYVKADEVSIVAHPQKSQVSRRHYEAQQQIYQNHQQPSPPQGQQQPQQAPQQAQYEQQTMNTGNGWGETSAGQKREQLNQQNNPPVEINDDALPFQTKPEPPQTEPQVTNSDDLPF